MSVLVFTAHALPLSVPFSVAPLSGAAHEMVGAACAASGIAPHTASAASAIGDLRNFMSSPLKKKQPGFLSRM
ncbi:MAG TPA: hypothetical protein VFJ70_16810 [Burkholderiales bacterium]|nr:hypothetical protein [Burkholderiales bacterium]